MGIIQKSGEKQKVTHSKWNTRKLIGFAVLFLGSLLLCFTSKASGAETYQLWVWLFGLYCAGNVGAKVISSPIMIDKLKAKLSRKK